MCLYDAMCLYDTMCLPPGDVEWAFKQRQSCPGQTAGPRETTAGGMWPNLESLGSPNINTTEYLFWQVLTYVHILSIRYMCHSLRFWVLLTKWRRLEKWCQNNASNYVVFKTNFTNLQKMFKAIQWQFSLFLKKWYKYIIFLKLKYFNLALSNDTKFSILLI